MRDLMSHRTGLAEGQGDFLGSVLPSPDFTMRLGGLRPLRTLRALFDYNNTGWSVAGEVLRAAAGKRSWCEALHALVLAPLSLERTYCHRNEIPDAVAAEHLASVHKMDPCRTSGSELACYEFVATGGADDFAWGAADAAGSVISSAREMATVMRLLLRPSECHVPGACGFLRPDTVAELLSAQMLVPASFLESSGVAAATDTQIGNAVAAGLGFDLVGRVMTDAEGRLLRYAEKNGDTEMHKARLGLLLERDQGVLLLSNLGGEVGGQLSALKFGALKMLAGGDEAAASAVAFDVLDNTDFWDEQYGPMTTCTVCGRSAYGPPCVPSSEPIPPLYARQYVGTYGNAVYSDGGGATLSVGPVLDEDPATLEVAFGPYSGAVVFDAASMSLLDEDCAAVEQFLTLQGVLPAHSAGVEALRDRARAGDACSLAEFRGGPPEMPEAGVSSRNGTIAFPWGMNVPIPDGPSFYAVTLKDESVLFFLFNGVAFGPMPPPSAVAAA